MHFIMHKLFRIINNNTITSHYKYLILDKMSVYLILSLSLLVL